MVEMREKRAEREAAKGGGREAAEGRPTATATAPRPTAASRQAAPRPKPQRRPPAQAAAPKTARTKRASTRKSRDAPQAPTTGSVAACSSPSRGSTAPARRTQAALLAEALGPETLLLREPGGTEAGERIRELLKDPALELDPRRRAAALLRRPRRARRAVIAPAHGAGRDVVCDRFIDSTVAYQGGARGLGARSLVERLNAASRSAIACPDLTVLLRVDPDEALARGQSGSRRRGRRRRPLRGRGARVPARGRRGLRRARRPPPRADRRRRRRTGDVDEVHARVLEAVERESAVNGRDRVELRRSRSPTRPTHQPAARVALAAALATPTHAYLFVGPAGQRQARRGPGVRRRAARRAARPTPTTPAAARSPTPRRIPTSSGCGRPAPSTWSRRSARGDRGRAPTGPFEGERRVFVIEDGRGDGRGEPERAAEDARGAGRRSPT